MIRSVHGAVVALALVGCGAEVVEPVAFAEVCGARAPVRLFALTPDQVLTSRAGLLAGQMYYPVARQSPPPGGAPYNFDLERLRDIELWTSGPCGESPRRVAGDVTYPFTYERWPDVVLGVRITTDEVVSIDPGREDPRVLLPRTGRWTPHGLLTIDREQRDVPGTLSLHPYPDDPRGGALEPVVLLDASVAPEHLLLGETLLSSTDDEAFIVADGTLLRVGLPDGEVTVEQPGVRAFQISADGRYLLWQDRQPLDGDFEAGVVILRDRTSGAGMSLARAALKYTGNPLGRTDDGIVVLNLGATQRVYFLPGLDFVDLPRELSVLAGPLDDGRWLLQAWWGGPIYVTGLRDVDTAIPLFSGGVPLVSEEDGLIVLDVPACCAVNQELDDGSLWFAPYDGSPPRRLADRASRYFRRLADGRLLTALDFDLQGIGDLVLIDPNSGAQQVIDRDVVVSGNYWHIAQDVVRYPVVDGERSGVWAVRLPPAG